MTPIISMKPDTPIRKKRVMNIDIDEKPQRTVRVLTNNRSREKFIKTCEKTIRASDEYREYIKFIKNVMHMDKCYVNPAISASNGKKYSMWFCIFYIFFIFIVHIIYIFFILLIDFMIF